VSPGPAGPARAATLLGLTVVYFAAGKLSLSLAQVHESASAVWPPTGIALAACLLLGRRAWPAIFAGAFAVNATTAGNVATSLGIATGNTLEGIVGAWLVTRFANGEKAFERARDVFKFMVLAGLGGTTLSATIGVTSLAAAGFASWADYGRIWLTWWLGDAAGAAVVAPPLILWFTNPPPSWHRTQILEAFALAIVIVLIGAVVFGGLLLPPERSYALEFLCLPPVIWTAFRFGRRATASSVLFFSATAVWGTLRGSGTLPSHSENESLLILQLFMAVLSGTATPLAVVVSEHRRALAVLARQTVELARSNTDLAEFAHVVSHDLKAPLRGISSLATWVVEDCEGTPLPAASREHLGLLAQRAQRLNRLVDGILSYSRVVRTPSARDRVDLKEVLGEVVDSLGPPEHVSIRIEGELPLLRHDRTQLVQVFQNLIGNAVQHLGRPSGTIVVSCRALEGAYEFCVRDDGRGIEERHFERIFRMFQSLNANQETTGVGLAIVKKIVEVNGGSISVESSVGSGTAFRFTIPHGEQHRRPA
jgi:signal transduction histidine kinase